MLYKRTFPCIFLEKNPSKCNYTFTPKWILEISRLEAVKFQKQIEVDEKNV